VCGGHTTHLDCSSRSQLALHNRRLGNINRDATLVYLQEAEEYTQVAESECFMRGSQ
jgi:hypothetical protein